MPQGRQVGCQPSPLWGKSALTLLCFYLGQYSLQERQGLPVVFSLHFDELRKCKDKH